jgi:hypothetical protein
VLLWEPDPLETPAEAALDSSKYDAVDAGGGNWKLVKKTSPAAKTVKVTKTKYEPMEITHDGEKWVKQPVQPKKKSVKEIEQEGFNKTIQKHVPGYVHDTFAPVKSVTVQTDFAAQPQKLFVKYQDGSTHEVTLPQGD